MAGCLVDGCPIEPLYDVGGCAVASLGVDVRIYDSGIEKTGGEESEPPVGREVADGISGELVIANSMPSFPVYFWGDHHHESDRGSEGKEKGKRGPGPKYRAAYFSRFRGVWTHGDFLYRDQETGAYILLGRADGVLNPSGVRFGSAEIYSVLEREFGEEVEDSVCVGQRREGDADERVLLFVKMKGGKRVDRGFVEAVKGAIAKALSRRHVPRFVFETGEIPVSRFFPGFSRLYSLYFIPLFLFMFLSAPLPSPVRSALRFLKYILILSFQTTINAKKVELPIKRIISGQKVIPSGTLANPACLEYYYQFVDPEAMERKMGLVGVLRESKL